MLSFTSSLSPDSEAFAIFVNDKFNFKDRKNILSKEVSKKINSYLGTLKDKKSEEEISSLDISGKQKCFIIKVKKKYETFYPEKVGKGLRRLNPCRDKGVTSLKDSLGTAF